MTPALQLAATALVAFTGGILLATISGRRRVRRARDARQKLVDALQSELAMKRFRIRELESELERSTAEETPAGLPLRIGDLPPQPMTWPRWLAGSSDRTPDSRSRLS